MRIGLHCGWIIAFAIFGGVAKFDNQSVVAQEDPDPATQSYQEWLKDTNLDPRWIYDDVELAKTNAAKFDKPILAVFR
ncbi:MAG: hypothetical protein KDA87_11550 [Planctomycetales bacterium]|nr:hypothetical protein [Planctomycetales bacterium]